MAEELGRLAEIAERLDATARRLGEGELDHDEAARLAEECASLASEAAAELERLGRPGPTDAPPGQEELL